MKTCSKCGKVRPIRDFYRAKTGKAGRQATCKACCAAYRAAHREKLRAWARAWYRANHARARLQKNAYYAANRDRILAYQRERYAELFSATDSDWSEVTP